MSEIERAHQLKSGEFMFCETALERDAARRALQSLGGKTQTVPAVNEQGVAGWRVWRL